MQHYPVTLGIARPLPQKGPGAPRKGPAAEDGKKIHANLKQSIFERDDYTCQCCGFKSKKYQEILHKNQVETDLSKDNLITACIFCHQCFYLEKVTDMRSGVLIWLPEIEQTTLHHIARAIYVARISQGPVAETARKALDILMGRREEVRKRIQTDDPYILSMVLKDYLSAGHYQMREKKLAGVRLLPLDRRIIKEADLEFNQFPQILAYWRSKDGPFGGKTPPQWVNIYKTLAKAA